MKNKDFINLGFTLIPTDMKHFPWILVVVAIVLIIIAALLNSCAMSPEVDPVCRHQALYAAVSWGDLRDEPIKIALGRTNKKIPGTNDVWWHAQAMAKVDGKWEWLCVECEVVTICGRDDFQPSKYMSAVEFAMWLIRGNPNLFKGGLR